jgi:hypothetical protein
VDIGRLRRIIALSSALSIASMIVFSVKDNPAGAMTGGVLGAIGVLCLMVGNAVHLGDNQGGAQEAMAAELDARVRELIDAGVDETAARSVVNKAVRYGRGDR